MLVQMGLQVILMLKKLNNFLKNELHVIDLHFSEFASSIGVMLIGYSLYIDRHYFFWPPSLSTLENDERIDILIICLGLGLLICTLTNNWSKAWTSFFLIMCGAVCLVIAGMQVLHMIYAGQNLMGHNTIGDFIVFILLVRAAYKV